MYSLSEIGFFDRLLEKTHIRTLRDSVQSNICRLLQSIGIVSNENSEFNDTLIESSVLNYGISNQVGNHGHSLSQQQLQKSLHTAILRFEPRILAESLTIKIKPADNTRTQLNILESNSLDAVQILIRCTLNTQPDTTPFELCIRPYNQPN